MCAKRCGDSDAEGPSLVALPSLRSAAHIPCDGEDSG
jgi:hypothetical protein